jgi:hypothetical protein
VIEEKWDFNIGTQGQLVDPSAPTQRDEDQGRHAPDRARTAARRPISAGEADREQRRIDLP